MSSAHSVAAMARYERLTEIAEYGTGSSVFYAGRQQETACRLIWQQKHGTGGSEMVKRYGSNGFDPGTIEVECGDLVHYDDYKELLVENERLKSEAGYTAADVATAAADGFRDGVRSVDLEQFRDAVESWKYRSECDMRRGYDVVGFEFLDSAKADSLECSRLLALIDAHKGE